MRLDKCVADHSTHARSEVRRLIRSGMVSVNGSVCRSADRQVDPDSDAIVLDGAMLFTASKRTYMMNKPPGVISATRDGRTPTVLSLLPPELRKGIFPAGRLDIDTTGMLLLTNDGDLAHRILAPKSHVEKFYLVQLAEPFAESYTAAFADGLTLEDGTKCRSAVCQGTKCGEKTALVALTEGKFHQVKRMFAAVENRVEHLHRVQMGGLPIRAELRPGDYMLLLNKDISDLLKSPDFSDVAAFCNQNFCSEWINCKA